MLRCEINAFMNYAPMYLCRVCSKNSNKCTVVGPEVAKI